MLSSFFDVFRGEPPPRDETLTDLSPPRPFKAQATKVITAPMAEAVPEVKKTIPLRMLRSEIPSPANLSGIAWIEKATRA